jgi:hypothetical protein
MILQPLSGYLHHMHYMKHQRRGPVSYAHIAFGRSLMLLGVINGGLGLQLAGAGMKLVTAYAVVSAIMGVAYAGIKGITSFRKRKAAAVGGKGIKIPGSSGSKEPFSPKVEAHEMARRDGNARN